ncbi:MAG: hypothetical protein WC974_05980 [Thermoplasmata archaeon]
MTCQQILLYEKTEKPKIFIPCPTEHPTIAHPTESDYLQAMLSSYLNDFYPSLNRTIYNNIFRNDIDFKETIDAQFNPYSVENIPPRIENVNIHSDVKYSWEEIKVSVDVVSSIWSIFNWIVKTITQIVTQKVEIVEHCWAEISCDVYDVSNINYVQIKVVDNGNSKSFTPYATSAHLEANLDIDYMKNYLWKYDVQISARDSGYNEITIKQEIGSAFYGFVTAVVALVAGAISAAVEFAVKMVNALYDWVMNAIKAMIDVVLKPIKNAIDNYAKAVMSAFKDSWDEYASTGKNSQKTLNHIQSLICPIFQLSFAMILVILIIASMLDIISCGAGTIVALGIGLIVSLILGFSDQTSLLSIGKPVDTTLTTVMRQTTLTINGNVPPSENQEIQLDWVQYLAPIILMAIGFLAAKGSLTALQCVGGGLVVCTSLLTLASITELNAPTSPLFPQESKNGYVNVIVWLNVLGVIFAIAGAAATPTSGTIGLAICTGLTAAYPIYWGVQYLNTHPIPPSPPAQGGG